MEIFLDSADLEAIRDYSIFIDGVTTNPSLLSKVSDPYGTIAEICNLIKGPVSVELTATTASAMINEISMLTNIASNIVIKLPANRDGLATLKHASTNGINTNVTLCFSPTQALVAAKLGATYVSPFVGRLDDIGIDGTELISDIKTIYLNYDFNTKILAASIRTIQHAVAAASIGTDAITVPVKVLDQFITHPLTVSGLNGFLADWNKAHNIKK